MRLFTGAILSPAVNDFARGRKLLKGIYKNQRRVECVRALVYAPELYENFFLFLLQIDIDEKKGVV